MNTSALETELREALSHLHDPDYAPSPALAMLLGADPGAGVLTVQSALLRAIEALAPSSAATANSPSQRIYDLLHNRFVLKLTLQETAERMSLSFSSTCRTQRAAVHGLARLLWERHQAAPPAGSRAGQPEEEAHPLPQNWREQAQRELAALDASSPGAVSDVGKVVQGACELLTPVLNRLGVTVEIAFVQPGVTAAIHPSVLRQLLIAAIRQMAEHAASPLAIHAGLQNGDARISISGKLRDDASLTPEALTADLLEVGEVITEAEIQGAEMQLVLELASIGAATVLLVDDNFDIARLYSRATEGTRYRVIHAGQGQGLFETIRAVAPDLVVLDVMLPDIDGWDLLMQLRAEAATRRLPVIVSSVVKEEELAMSLGATRFLPKPVRPRELIRVLDQLLPQD